jgi:hypothetical protein
MSSAPTWHEKQSVRLERCSAEPEMGAVTLWLLFLHGFHLGLSGLLVSYQSLLHKSFSPLFPTHPQSGCLTSDGDTHILSLCLYFETVYCPVAVFRTVVSLQETYF